jgi:molybdopterin-binding protein
LNSIKGHIAQIHANGSFQLLAIKAGKDIFKSIIIRNKADGYTMDDPVVLHFKETEVSLATKKLDEISLQNQITGTIQSVEKDDLLSRVTLKTAHGLISSIITTASAERLGLREGMSAVALIKTNEVMLSRA